MDPYTVIGVSPGASDEDIKKKYRELVKKFHPDRYSGTGMEDVANEKMQRVNEAYDAIMSERKGKKTQSSGSRYQGSYQHQGSGNYARIRLLIDQGQIVEAESLLNSIRKRDAEWHYLSGLVAWRRGWNTQARQNMQMAVNMDPGNMEYRQALNQLNMTFNQSQYRGQGRNMNSGGCDICNICGGLMCADCCCECAGGDLISCC